MCRLTMIPKVFATDASLNKGAFTSKELEPDVAEALWLGGDRKGAYPRSMLLLAW